MAEARTVVIAGSSGLIGTALTKALRSRGDTVFRLVRRPAAATDEIAWAPGASRLAPSALEGSDAVICLCGASVGRLPWSARYQLELRRSRLEPTHAIVDALSRIHHDAPSLLSASAVGYYGSQPGRALNEDSPAGATFLARLCVDWEAEARKARATTRVALLRTAPVLDRRGMLAPMIALAKLGLAGPVGTGRQVWAWISLADEVRAILHILDHGIEGPVNLASPRRATADELGRHLSRALNRPYWLPAPGRMLNAALGRDAAQSLLTQDADVHPDTLQQAGFEFRDTDPAAAVADALRH